MAGTRVASKLVLGVWLGLFLTACPPAEPGGNGDAQDSGGSDSGTDQDAGADAGFDAGAPGPTADLRLLTFSDWHGQLDPLRESSGPLSTTYGGVGLLAVYFAQEKAEVPDLLILTGGDNIGASPALSAEFEDRPAIEGLNFLGLDSTTFGNHEFDRGLAHLRTVLDAGQFSYISTNLNNVSSELGSKVVTPYQVVELGAGSPKLKVALIGLTNPDAPSLTFPGRMGTLTVAEPAAAANAAAANARAAGAHVVVVLAHMGATGRDSNQQPVGPVVTLANALQGVDVLVADHTDLVVNQVINGVLVVENRSKGRTYARINLTVTDGGVSARTAEIIDPVGTKTLAVTPACTADGGLFTDGGAPSICPGDGGWSCVTGRCVATVANPDPAWEAQVAPYRAALSQRFDEKVGVTEELFVRTGTIERTQEVAIGDLVADAMLTRYRSAGAEIAFTNGGGIRAPLPSSYTPSPDAGLARPPGSRPWDLVKGDIFTVLPFGNTCVVRPITGQLLWSVLEHSVARAPTSDGRFLQIAGFKFEYQVSAAPGSRVRKVTLLEADGGLSDIPSGSQRVLTAVTNDFTNAGGDGYSMLVETSPSAGREVVAEVLVDHVRARSPISFATVDGGVGPDGGFVGNRVVVLP